MSQIKCQLPRSASKAFVERWVKVSAQNLWMNNVGVMFLHTFTMYSFKVNQCPHFIVIYIEATPKVWDSFIVLLQLERKAVTNVFYESITGHQTAIKYHILSKINKQVYQAGSNSSFQETHDLFLPQATGLPGKWVNTVNSTQVFQPALGKCTESKKATHIF